MAEKITVDAKLETGMRFEVETGSGHTVTLDAGEHGGGQNAGFRPLEMLLRRGSQILKTKETRLPLDDQFRSRQ